MPGLIQELRDSRTFDVNVTGGTAQFKYVITGETDESAAYDLVLAESPDQWFGYTRDNIDMKNRPALGVWFPVVNYSIPVYNVAASSLPTAPVTDPAPTSSPSSSAPAAGSTLAGVSVSVALENQRVYQSIKTIDKGAVGGGVPRNYAGLIGVAKGEVEGVEIGVPVANIVYKKTIPYLTAGYFKNLIALCGKTNEEAWWLFQPEEGLFVGCNGQSKGTGEFEIDYEFRYAITERDITIVEGEDDGLVCPEKRGWHYLWVANQDKVVGGVKVQQPKEYYVEQVYKTDKFTRLGI